ncbi:ABC transporter ATP-binding protein [Vagococcus salmoninarum]|uniref:ABC transporter ATP-binding protein n=1 Tax=Vagococcus salmoninarum TaxID=2739 RepID=UPI0028D655C9|nr:ABC transporter ATP-binding protein [Vagococcus salmoninarum]
MNLELKDVQVRLGKQLILNQLRLEVPQGEILGLMAPNGTGKTTLFRAIANLIGCQEGTIEINGYQSKEREKYFQQLFFLENNESLMTNLTPETNLAYVKKMWQSPLEVRDVINRLGMEKYRKKPVKHLSLGMKQHLLIGMYLISDAPVLLFDEPLNGLDLGSVELVNSLFQRLHQQGKTVMITSHNLHHLQTVCQRFIFIKDKKISRSTTNPEVISEIYRELYFTKEGE